MSNNLINILKKERLELLDKLSRIEGLIKLYQQSFLEIETVDRLLTIQRIDQQLQKSNMSVDQYFAYDISQPIRKKILDIIKNENRFLHVREIANIAHQFEQNIPVSIFVKKISPALSVLKNLPQSSLVSIEVANSHFNTFWGSKAWLNEEGEIRSEYMYNSNQLSSLNKVIYSI
jgi:hypothetical protein